MHRPLTVLLAGARGEPQQPGWVAGAGVHSVGAVKCCLLSSAQAPVGEFLPWGQ